MNQSVLQSVVSRWPMLAGGAGLLLAAAIVYGCDSGSKRQIPIDPSADHRDEDKCSTRLASALDEARPSSLGLVGVDAVLRNRPVEAAQAFSEWLRQPDCRDAVPAEPISDEGKALIVRLLGANEAATIGAERFTAFDAAHVRDALLDFATAGRLTRDARTDLDRAVRLFDYVSRTVSAEGESSVEVSQSAYEAHLFGRGSAETRALLFANLLRQLRLDAVVLRPAPAEGEPAPWWIGVLLDDGVFLFDPELGLPVPAADETPATPTYLPKPATWAEAVANPELLAAYRREAGLTAEPPAAERLASVQVELIGPAAFWKTAMERLELSLPGDRGVLLYDPLHDTQAGLGLFRRVADSGRSAWTEGAIIVWSYPAEFEAARADLEEAPRQRLEQRAQKFLGLIEPDPKTGRPTAQKSLWETRIDHMSGRAAGSIVRYLDIRNEQMNLAQDEIAGLSPNEKLLNRQAADEAFYWTGHAQFDEAQYGAAANTVRSYIELGGDRVDEATTLLALSLAAQGKRAEAADEIAKLPEGTPSLPRLKWLALQWKAGAAN